MKLARNIAFISAILLFSVAIGVKAVSSSERPMDGGQKCSCSIVETGDARCFFDGSRCPKSGGKCDCFRPPSKENFSLSVSKSATPSGPATDVIPVAESPAQDRPPGTCGDPEHCPRHNKKPGPCPDGCCYKYCPCPVVGYGSEPAGVKSANRMGGCSCGGNGCMCAWDNACSATGGAVSCGCNGVDCDCVSTRCSSFSTVSDCTGWTLCNSDNRRHCNRHSCP